MRYVLHPDVTARAGRIGDTVTMMRGGRSLSRRFVQPENPRSSAQGHSRSLLIRAASVWSSCTPTERTGWNDLADAYYADKLDSLGNPAPWSGQMLCTATHIHRFAANQAADPDAYQNGVYVDPKAPVAIELNTALNRLTIDFEATPTMGGYVRPRVTSPMPSLDYAPNSTRYRSPWLYNKSHYSYQYNSGYNYEEWVMGVSLGYATPEFKALEDGDIVAIDILWLSTNYVPCPSGSVFGTAELSVL
jgi:hypothetical protein